MGLGKSLAHKSSCCYFPYSKYCYILLDLYIKKLSDAKSKVCDSTRTQYKKRTLQVGQFLCSFCTLLPGVEGVVNDSTSSSSKPHQGSLTYRMNALKPRGFSLVGSLIFKVIFSNTDCVHQFDKRFSRYEYLDSLLFQTTLKAEKMVMALENEQLE